MIEKKRQGLGKPDIIYVKNFVTLETEPEEVGNTENMADNVTSAEPFESDLQKFENRTSRSRKIEF